MKTMAEVIQEAIENTPYWIPGDPGTHQDPYVNAAEALTAAGYGLIREATTLIRDLTDPDDCHFDHHGGCQAHGYLDLKIGEMCPQLQAKAWARNHPEANL